MTDRELLELAAKAAGIKFHAYVDSELFGSGINTGELDVPLWNPLLDDGDALRLAVKLRLVVQTPTTDDDIALVKSHTGAILGDAEGGIYESTRRAIVLAAAEVGKAMS